MKQLTIKVTLLEDALALLPGTPDSFSRFLEFKKAKLNKQQAAHVEDMEEEEKRAIKERLETLKIDQAENSVSVFPIDKETGKPFYYDYQIRGFFKDAARGLKDCLQIKKSKTVDEDTSKEENPDAKLKKALSKCKYLASFAGFSKMPATWVDRGIFVGPRNVIIEMPEDGKIGFCERPLRIEKFPQPIVSIKCSECVPAGSVLKFKVGILMRSSFSRACTTDSSVVSASGATLARAGSRSRSTTRPRSAGSTRIPSSSPSSDSTRLFRSKQTIKKSDTPALDAVLILRCLGQESSSSLFFQGSSVKGLGDDLMR